jgi:hypothetical protein
MPEGRDGEMVDVIWARLSGRSAAVILRRRHR